MGNIFDNLQSNMIDTVTTTMGYAASWTPLAGGDELTGAVLYKGPTEKEKLANADYDPDKLTLEYKQGLFTGLKEAADESAREVISIETVGEFFILSVSRRWDGKTYEARLQVKT